MYNDYEREEIIDTAMDIFENTDATLEEAMGVAMENQTRKLKAEARKTGNWDKVIMRQGLKDAGKVDVADRAYNNAREADNNRYANDKFNNLRHKYAEYNRPGIDNLPEKFNGEANTKQYQDRASKRQREFDKRANQVHSYMNGAVIHRRRMANDSDNADERVFYMGDYSKSVPANNGRGTRYAVAKKHEKASKEAAIMDTALDYMDMYDVSMETAIDMAYEDYED